jgi:6-phosphogluconate dehydrogenase
MVPAEIVDETIAEFVPHLETGDIQIAGSNSYIGRRYPASQELTPRKIHDVDVCRRAN